MTVGGFMTQFAAEMADGLPLGFLGGLGGRGQLEARMHTLAIGSLGAEARHVVDAEDAPHVAVAAMWPVAAEASVVPAQTNIVYFFALFIIVITREETSIFMQNFGPENIK